LLFAACEEAEPSPATQVLVTVDSDLDVPSEIDTVRIAVDDIKDGRESDSHDFKLARNEAARGEVELPFSFGIAKAGQSEFMLRVIGLKDTEPVVELDWNVRFEDGTTLGVSPFLGEVCAHAGCKNGQTCFPRKRGDIAAGACASVPAAETTAVRGGGEVTGAVSEAARDAGR
jgi:hypothetical protein